MCALFICFEGRYFHRLHGHYLQHSSTRHTYTNTHWAPTQGKITFDRFQLVANHLLGNKSCHNVNACGGLWNGSCWQSALACKTSEMCQAPNDVWIVRSRLASLGNHSVSFNFFPLSLAADQLYPSRRDPATHNTSNNS